MLSISPRQDDAQEPCHNGQHEIFPGFQAPSRSHDEVGDQSGEGSKECYGSLKGFAGAAHQEPENSVETTVRKDREDETVSHEALHGRRYH